MKKILNILATFAAISCMAEIPEEKHNPLATGRTIEVNMPRMTKTSLGDNTNNGIQVVWNQGDEIAVIENKGLAGQKHSIYRLVEGGGTTTGVFEYVSGDAVSETVTDVVYPAKSIGNGYAIPATQTYTESSFDPQALIMSWTRTEANEPIVLSHDAAVLRLTLTSSETRKISAVKVTCDGTAYSLICPESISLSGTAKDFHIVIPGSTDSRDYGFTIYPVSGLPMARSAGHVLQNGYIGVLPKLEYTPLKAGDIFDNGIVFEVKDDYAKIASLDEHLCCWCQSSVMNERLGTDAEAKEGISNTEIIMARSDKDLFDAAIWCTGHGTDWYMPSREEIKSLVDNLALTTAEGQASANERLTKNGGTAFSCDKYHWSSCEDASDAAKARTIRLKDKGSNSYSKYNKSSLRPVRAVRKVFYADEHPNPSPAEPEFGDEVKVLPEAGERERYSPSLNSKYYRPVATQYMKTWASSPKWESANARIVPYLVGFEDYQMNRSEYLESTNKYGSSTELPRQKVTGRFYVTKVDGRFYLVDPEGYLHHHRGVASLRPSKDADGNDNAAFVSKYGDRSTWLSQVQEELASIGIHSSGAFSTVQDDILDHNRNNPDKPILLCPSFSFLSQFKSKYKLSYCGDNSNTAICLVLDENWDDFCDEYISTNKTMQKFLKDPNVVGIFSDNEIDFTSLSSTLLQRILDTKDTDHPAYKAAKQFMKDNGASEVTDALNQEWAGMLAEKYYKGVKTALQKHDPDMLYLGSRLHGQPKTMEQVFRAAAKWCDVISINYYGYWSVEAFDHVQKWAQWAPDTPFMITEFYTKGHDSTLPNSEGAGFLVHTQKDRAYAYQHITLGLLEARNCIGWHWFKYQDDDPVEYGEKAANKGLYDQDYNLYPWMAEYVKTLNYNTYRLIEYFDN